MTVAEYIAALLARAKRFGEAAPSGRPAPDVEAFRATMRRLGFME